jgi:hypothetical protein
MENYFLVHLTEPLPVNLLPLILNIPLSCLLSPMLEHDLGFHAVQHAKADAGSTCSCYGLRWVLYVCLLPLPLPFLLFY